MAREMKDSGIEWIGKIPGNWAVYRGKILFRQRNEKGNAISLQLLSPTQKYGVIPQSMYEELSGMNAVKLDENVDYSQLKTIHQGDFFISLRSFQGGFEYSDYEGVVSPAYQVFFPIREICNNYYKYLFKSKAFIDKMNSYALSLRDGKNIAFSDFADTYIPYPPISEQKRISVFLDTKCSCIEAIVKLVRDSIEECKKLKLSIITQAVTKGIHPDRPMKDSGIPWIGIIPSEWACTILKSHCHFQTGSTPSTENNQWFNGELNWFTPADFDDSYFLADSSRKLSLLAKEDGVATIIPAQTVMIIGIGGTAGKVGFTVTECSCNQQITAIFPDDELCSRYLMYWMIANTKRLKDTALYTTLPIINNQTIGQYLSLVPATIEEQVEIADYLDSKLAEINNLIEKKERLLSELESYKKSLVFDYVTGKRGVE